MAAAADAAGRCCLRANVRNNPTGIPKAGVYTVVLCGAADDYTRMIDAVLQSTRARVLNRSQPAGIDLLIMPNSLPLSNLFEFNRAALATKKSTPFIKIFPLISQKKNFDFILFF